MLGARLRSYYSTDIDRRTLNEQKILVKPCIFVYLLLMVNFVLFYNERLEKKKLLQPMRARIRRLEIHSNDSDM